MINEEAQPIQSIMETIQNLFISVGSGQSVSSIDKARLNKDILDFITKHPHNEQYNLAYTIYKSVLDQLGPLIEKLIIQFNEKLTSEQYISRFIQCYELYVNYVKQIFPATQCLKELVNSKDKEYPELNRAAKMKFVLYFKQKAIFENCIFKCLVDTLKYAREVFSKSKKDAQKISDLLRNFGLKISELQIAFLSYLDTSEHRIEDEFKSKIFEYFEQTYQDYFPKWIQEYNTAEYLEKVNQELEINTEIIRFQDPEILKEVNKILQSHLLTAYKKTLLAENNKMNFKILVQNYKSNPHSLQSGQQVLQLICSLYAHLNDHYDQITQNFKEIIKQDGIKLMNDKNERIVVEQNEEGDVNDKEFRDREFITSLFQLYNEYSQMITRCFNSNSDFQMALNNAFEAFINISIGNNIEISDYLVMCMHDLLEEQQTKKSKNDNKLLFENLVQLFVFLNHKERFFKLYKRQLAQRLLNFTRYCNSVVKNNQKKKQLENEELAVKEMETRCGTQEIEALKLMITDMQAKQQQEFAKLFLEKQQTKLPISGSTIINKANWPIVDERQITYFQCIELAKGQISCQQGEKQLNWIDCLSIVDVFYAEKNRTFNMTLPQALILFQFNYNNSPLSIQELSERTNLPEKYVINNCKILVKNKLFIEVNDGKYEFYIGMYAKSKSPKSKPLQIETDYDVLNQVEQVKLEHDKDSAIEACIVKIMKKGKEMQISDLVVKVQMELSQFGLTFNQIKLVMEKLQRNEYLERDANNIQIIRYK